MYLYARFETEVVIIDGSAIDHSSMMIHRYKASIVSCQSKGNILILISRSKSSEMQALP